MVDTKNYPSKNAANCNFTVSDFKNFFGGNISACVASALILQSLVAKDVGSLNCHPMFQVVRAHKCRLAELLFRSGLEWSMSTSNNILLDIYSYYKITNAVTTDSSRLLVTSTSCSPFAALHNKLLYQSTCWFPQIRFVLLLGQPCLFTLFVLDIIHFFKAITWRRDLLNCTALYIY